MQPVKAKAHEKAADFCAGSGIVGLHFYALNPEKVESVALFEMQKDLSDMSRRSVALNGLKNFTAVNCRVQDIGKEYDEYFSLVLANPPYERGGFENDDYKKAICRKEIEVNLKEIATAASFALKFGGRIALVNRADRLAEVAYTLHEAGIELKRIRFVCGKEGAKPYLLLAEGVKGGKPNTEILPTLVNRR